MLKDDKAEKDPKATLDVSPSAKGTLDGYLVKSPDSGSPGDRRSTGRGTPSRHDPVKRNLTLEIGSGLGTMPNACVGSSGLGVGVNSVKIERFGGVQAGANGSIEQGPAVLEACNAVECGDGNSELKKFATDFLSLYCRYSFYL